MLRITHMIERLPLETQTLYAEFLAQLLSASTTHSIGRFGH